MTIAPSKPSFSCPSFRGSLMSQGACAIVAWVLTTSVPGHAQSLPEALQQAYARSEQVASAEAEHNADREGIVISRADGLPTVGTSVELNETLAGRDTRSGLVTVQGRVSVPLYQGGSVRHSVNAARSRADASSIAVATAESEVFTAVVAAYANVIRDRRIVELSRTNLQSLSTTLDATRARYRARDLTRTDVAQSDARVALARGELESATARLQGSLEELRRLTGFASDNLAPLPEIENLPPTAEMAVAIARDENPQLISARSILEARRHEVRAARGQALPRVSAVVNGNYSDGQPLVTTQPESRFGATVGVSMNMSLFQGGRVPAQVRQASLRENQAELEVQGIERTLTARARSEFANWQAARAVVLASEQAVDASRQALSGVRAESDVGTRTILDILNAEQELRNAQVQLVTAQRDAYVAAFSLLATMGKAQARNLGIERRNTAFDVTVDNPQTDDSESPSGMEPTGLTEGLSEGPAPAVPAEVPQPVAAVPAAAVPAASRIVSIDPDADPGAAARSVPRSADTSMAAGTIPPNHWVIQLAAHNSVPVARTRWMQVRSTVNRIAPRAVPLVASANSPTPIFRLAVGAFADFNAAETVCHDLRAEGVACIVRRFSTLGTIEWSDRSNLSTTER